MRMRNYSLVYNASTILRVPHQVIGIALLPLVALQYTNTEKAKSLQVRKILTIHNFNIF